MSSAWRSPSYRAMLWPPRCLSLRLVTSSKAAPVRCWLLHRNRGQSVSAFHRWLIVAVPLRGGTPDEVQAHARETQCDYVLLSEVAEVKKPAGKKFGGLMARTGLVNQKEALEARVDYRLVKTGEASPVMASSVIG